MNQPGDYIPIAVALLGLLGGFLLALLNRRAEMEARRRQAYAAAMQVLVEWIEYPYRIRRRTSDDPSELRRLADVGHDLQQRLRYHRTWVLLEHARTGALYKEILGLISGRVGPSCRNAWTLPPIRTAAEMNLDGWGPGSMLAELSLLEGVISDRFGWRRFLPWTLGRHEAGRATFLADQRAVHSGMSGEIAISGPGPSGNPDATITTDL